MTSNIRRTELLRGVLFLPSPSQRFLHFTESDAGFYERTTAKTPSDLEDIPAGTTTIHLADFVESEVEWPGHSKTLRTPAFNENIYTVYWSQAEADKDRENFIRRVELPVHPSLKGRAWIVGGSAKEL